MKTQVQSSIKQNIATIYGAAIEKEIVPFELDEMDGPLKFKISGQVIYLNTSTKIHPGGLLSFYRVLNVTYPI